MLAAELVEATMSAMESIKTILFGKTDDTKVQIARNAVVEGVRYATNMLILWTLTEFVLGKEYLGVSTAIASLLAGLVNYAFSSLWVFHKVEKKAEKNLLQFALFTAIGAIGLGINVGITTFLTRQMDVNYLISNTIAQIAVFFFNFFMRKKFVFEKEA
ncbi:MAG: GtrA family protein [Bacteroidales bacterium]|nr:GtrA family protein [Bacteroidales bacterium]